MRQHSKKQTQKNTLKLRGLTLANLELLKQKTTLEERLKILVKRDRVLSQINERLQKDNTIKSEFVSTVAHQIRTPLTRVKWAIQVLFDEGKNTFSIEQKNLIKKALNATNDLVALLNNLLKKP